MIKNQKRIEWIDCLKGILLILICCSHIGYIPSFIQPLIDPVGKYWVPCFFFISGILFEPYKYKGFSDVVKSKVRTLLIPYLSFSFIFILLDWNIIFNFHKYLSTNWDAIYHGDGAAKAAPLWFVLVLFYITIISYILVSKKVSKNILMIILLMIVGYFISKIPFRLPLQLNVILPSTSVFMLGYIYKCYFINLKTRWKYWILMPCIIFFIIGLRHDYGILNRNAILNYPMFFLTCISACIFLCTASSLVKRRIYFFSFIANNGLVLLACHCYIFYLIDKLLEVSNIEIGLPVYFFKFF